MKALLFTPEDLSSFANWAQMWTLELANKDEAQLWLRANIVSQIREVDNPNGSTKSKLRPIAHLETPLKLIVAVHQHADHIIALMQEQQVGFQGQRRSRGDDQRSEKFPEKRHKQSLDARWHIEHIWLNQPVGSVARKHDPSLAPLCASQFWRRGNVAVIQERDGSGKNGVAKGVCVWQGSTLSTATFCLTS